MKIHGVLAVWLACTCFLLSACHNLSPRTDKPTADANPDPASTPQRDWLLVRAELCQLNMPEQRARMMELTVRASSRDEHMERALLASCNPEHTPGLLREALQKLEGMSATESEQALVTLLRDHARSYRVLEEKNAQLAEQLEATINGIRDIETELDTLRPNRVIP